MIEELPYIIAYECIEMRLKITRACHRTMANHVVLNTVTGSPRSQIGH
jgi:hypothetical protein